MVWLQQPANQPATSCTAVGQQQAASQSSRSWSHVIFRQPTSACLPQQALYRWCTEICLQLPVRYDVDVFCGLCSCVASAELLFCSYFGKRKRGFTITESVLTGDRLSLYFELNFVRLLSAAKTACRSWLGQRLVQKLLIRLEITDSWSQNLMESRWKSWTILWRVFLPSWFLSSVLLYGAYGISLKMHFKFQQFPIQPFRWNHYNQRPKPERPSPRLTVQPTDHGCETKFNTASSMSQLKSAITPQQ